MGYSNAQLREILRAAGWPEALIPLMAAIGQSESSGDPTSYRNCPGNGYCTVTQGGITRTVREVPGQGPETSAGLWQINLRSWPMFTAEWLRDPINSAKAALYVFRESKNSFRPWGSFTDGGYKKYFSGSLTPDLSGISGGDWNIGSGIGATVGDVLGLGWVKSYFFEDKIPGPMERFKPFIDTPQVSAETRILIATVIIIIILAFTWREF